MSIKITVSDGLTPLLDKIFELNYGYGLDALDHAGTKIRENTRSSFDSFAHQWRQEYVISKRGENKGKSYRKIYKQGVNHLGKRINHVKRSGLANPSSMRSMITSYLMKESMTMIVGGMHPEFRADKFRDGKIVGQVTKPTRTVTKATHALLRKLNDGKMNSEYRKFHRKKNMHRFINANYESRGFYAKGRNASMGQVKNIMTTKLDALLQKAYDRANVTAKQSTTRRAV